MARANDTSVESQRHGSAWEGEADVWTEGRAPESLAFRVGLRAKESLVVTLVTTKETNGNDMGHSLPSRATELGHGRSRGASTSDTMGPPVVECDDATACSFGRRGEDGRLSFVARLVEAGLCEEPRPGAGGLLRKRLAQVCGDAAAEHSVTNVSGMLGRDDFTGDGTCSDD
jgi:hypothetical protein